MAGLIAPGRRAVAGNCVLYARAETGVSLFGAAGGWWDEAAGVYQRGHVPTVGSILVFKRTGQMPSGHVAVVSKVVGPGMVLVDQSNWYRGRVTRDTPVIDTSSDHDWTRVAVQYPGSGEFGRDSPTYGFVYPETGSPEIVAVRAAGRFDPDLAVDPAAYEPEGDVRLFRFAVARDGRHARVRHRRAAHSRTATHDGRGHDHRRSARASGHASARSAHRSAAHAAHSHRTHVVVAERAVGDPG